MSHAHPKKGRGLERGGDEKKRTNGERWLWRLVRQTHAGNWLTEISCVQRVEVEEGPFSVTGVAENISDGGMPRCKYE